MLDRLAKTWSIHPTPWIEFLDDDDWQLCQPDGVVETDSGVCVIEVKLTQTSEARRELRELYLPVVEFYWQQPVCGVQICRALQSKVQDWLFMGPQAEIDSIPEGQIGTWFLRV